MTKSLLQEPEEAISGLPRGSGWSDVHSHGYHHVGFLISFENERSCNIQPPFPQLSELRSRCRLWRYWDKLRHNFKFKQKFIPIGQYQTRSGQERATNRSRGEAIITKRQKQSKELQFCSVQFSCSVVSNSLQPHGLQHTMLPSPSPTPGVYSNSCPLSQWCHPTISFSVIPFSSCLQSFPTSGSFQMSQLFASGGQSLGVSASASVLPMNIQDWFPLEFIGWIFLQSKGFSRVFSNTTVQKHQFFSAQLAL